MQKIAVYEPGNRQSIGLFRSWVVIINNLMTHHELIGQLFWRDFISTYKRSFLGLTWWILAPLLGIVSWVFMNATGVLKPGDVGIAYPAYILLGTTIWSLFMGFYTSASQTLNAGSGFIQQVKFPHEVLLIKQTAQHLATFLISFLITLVVLSLFRIIPQPMTLLFPIIVLPLFFLGAGIGLIISVFSAMAVDIQKSTDICIGLLMYFTPVIYAKNIDNVLIQKVINWNPLTYLISAARDIIIVGHINDLHRYLLASCLSVFIFLFAWRLFYLSEDRVIEKMI